MKTALFLATEKGYTCLKRLIENRMANYVGFVSVFTETNVKKSYDSDIKELCAQNGIKCLEWKELKENLINLIETDEIDIAFTVAWKFLINTEINKKMKYGLCVFHDSLLPKYRGFAPTPTAIICGEKNLGITAIYANESVDEGDIILQKSFSISDDDYIFDVIRKEADICADMLVEILKNIEAGKIGRVKQDNSQATYSIWRDPEDCLIDWNASAVEIRNLIRAVSTPYPGAYFYYKGEKVVVNRAEICPDMEFAIRQPGKIWSIKNNQPIVICGQGMLQITDACYDNGESVKFNLLRQNLNRH